MMQAHGRSRWLFTSMFALLTGGTAAACSGDGLSPEAGESEEAVGSVGLELKVGDVVLDSLSYFISGNGYSREGVLNVSKSKTISALIGGIPAGRGYLLSLSGVAANDAQIQCTGSVAFSVAARSTTTAVVSLECRLPGSDTGSVKIVGDASICPRIDALSVEPSEVAVGGSMALSAAVTDQDLLPAPVTYAWSASGGTLANATSPQASFTCTETGSFDVTLLVSDTACSDTATTTVTCSPEDGTPAPRPNVKINEVESNGGVPGDWTELYNAGSAPADISGWVFKDNDDTHAYTLPAGTVIPAGGYFVIEEAAQNFGLGAADSVRLFDAAGVLVDSYAWTAHAAVTYGRCPNGTGGFTSLSASSKGAENGCAPVGPVTFAWPGQNDVVTVDLPGQWTSNLSGLTYEPATATSTAVLWAVVNGPGTLYRLIDDGTHFVPDTNDDWGLGKALRYTHGSGNPDSEGVTFGATLADGVYVAAERNNDASTISRSSVLRFDVSASGAELTATHEFNLTSLLPVVGANLGIEAITWIPDSFLVAKGFFDETAGHPYNPSEYPNHGTGLFFVGVEGNGRIYAFALNHETNVASLVAVIVSGQTGVMALEFDREVGYFWFTCDDTCGNKSAILDIDAVPGSPTLGRFVVRRLFDRPSSLPNSNNEGFAIAPQAECVGGFKPVFWADDNSLETFSLRRDSIPCGSFLGSL